MRKIRRGHKIHWSRAILTGIFSALVLAGMAPILHAFKIGFLGEPPIHENLTSAAIGAVMPNADPLFVMDVQSGVFNTDLSHQPIAAFHFDKSTTAGQCPQLGLDVPSCGFDNGFNAIYGTDPAAPGSLTLALSEATICDSTTGACGLNPLFLHPLHASFTDLAEDIIGTYNSLFWNGDCWSVPACPTDDFGTSVVWMQTEMLPMFIDTDPDPDEVTAFTFLGTSINVPNFAEDLATAKSNLDALLGPHCGWDGSCFDTLEQMTSDGTDFQNLANHLRVLQYEYQAYYAWQHLGHAFHTTQDFFAHSNYVELASGRKGPQCDPSSYLYTSLCDFPLDVSNGPYTAIRLPSDGSGWIGSIANFRSIFGKQALQDFLNKTGGFPSIFGDDNFNHLQTGFFPCAGDVPLGGASVGGEGTGYDNGFYYCHTATGSIAPPAPGSAGMNKDKEYAVGSELNHKNFPWALASAQRMSIIMFEAFVSDLLGPSTGNYVSANSAITASQRSGEMAWLTNSSGPSRIGPNLTVVGNVNLLHSTSGILSGPQQLQAGLPTLAATVSTSGPSSSPVTDVVTVTNAGKGIPGATVAVGNSTFTTNSNGQVVITHAPCFRAGQVGQVGGTTVPLRVPVPCGWAATASKPGYQPFSFTVP